MRADDARWQESRALSHAEQHRPRERSLDHRNAVEQHHAPGVVAVAHATGVVLRTGCLAAYSTAVILNSYESNAKFDLDR